MNNYIERHNKTSRTIVARWSKNSELLHEPLWYNSDHRARQFKILVIDIFTIHNALQFSVTPVQQ